MSCLWDQQGTYWQQTSDADALPAAEPAGESRAWTKIRGRRPPSDGSTPMALARDGASLAGRPRACAYDEVAREVFFMMRGSPPADGVVGRPADEADARREQKAQNECNFQAGCGAAAGHILPREASAGRGRGTTRSVVEGAAPQRDLGAAQRLRPAIMDENEVRPGAGGMRGMHKTAASHCIFS